MNEPSFEERGLTIILSDEIKSEIKERAINELGADPSREFAPHWIHQVVIITDPLGWLIKMVIVSDDKIARTITVERAINEASEHATLHV